MIVAVPSFSLTSSSTSSSFSSARRFEPFGPTATANAASAGAVSSSTAWASSHARTSSIAFATAASSPLTVSSPSRATSSEAPLASRTDLMFAPCGPTNSGTCLRARCVVSTHTLASTVSSAAFAAARDSSGAVSNTTPSLRRSSSRHFCSFCSLRSTSPFFSSRRSTCALVTGTDSVIVSTVCVIASSAVFAAVTASCTPLTVTPSGDRSRCRRACESVCSVCSRLPFSSSRKWNSVSVSGTVSFTS